MYTLITGGSGFIGQNYILYLQKIKKLKNVINIDCLNYAGKFQNHLKLSGDNSYTFIKGSINNKVLLNKVFEKYRISKIIHFAAQTHVDKSIKSSEKFFVNNVIGTLKLLEKSKEINWEKNNFKFILISTDEIFGSLSKNQRPSVETSSYQPKNPYAASKASANHLVQSFISTFSFPAIIINCSNNYGPFQHTEKFIPKIITNALTNKKIPIYGNGLQIRDWIFVQDTCRAIYKIQKHGRIGNSYNVGGNIQIKNLDLAKKICSLISKLGLSKSVEYKKLITFVNDRPGHDKRYNISTKKINNEFGWSPKENFNSGLTKTIEWYLNLILRLKN